MVERHTCNVDVISSSLVIGFRSKTCEDTNSRNGKQKLALTVKRAAAQMTGTSAAR